ncbi:hypothetical protein [Aestuariivirga sp.]|uniref:hypothetical protein n=1 Tax=Aestuariivirga sp. TaxID=2650926 RepID=UPI0039E3D46C
MSLALVSASVALMPASANAKSNFMTECSARYKAAKAAGTVTDATKWTDYMKTQCADLKASSDAQPADNTTAAAPAPATTTKKKTTATTAAPASTTKTTDANGSFMQTCSASWKQLKDANEVPSGMTWKAYVKGGCNVQDSASAADEKTTPSEPGSGSDWSDIAVKTTDKNGKPFTPGQIALHQRMKECGNEWRADKAANTLPAGSKWPQFWSTCNTRLKSNQG